VVTGTRLLVNLSEPSQVERAAALDVDGVGLLRAELMIVDGTHPRQLLEENRSEEFVQRMATALTTFAAGFAPRPVTYRTTDFRTSEFRGLRGGEAYEPQEANPMIGYRGALCYTRDPEVFRLELEAISRVGRRDITTSTSCCRSCARRASWRAAASSSKRPGCSRIVASSCG
jgi:pyruvate, water dikinase